MENFAPSLPQRTSILACVLLTMAVGAIPAAATLPQGKHYASVFVVKDWLGAPLDVIFDCLSFSKDEMCIRDGACGPFRFTEKGRKRNRWEGEIDFIDDAGPEKVVVHARFVGMTENMGARSSISATAILEREGVTSNTGIAGTQVKKGLCIEFADSDSN